MGGGGGALGTRDLPTDYNSGTLRGLGFGLLGCFTEVSMTRDHYLNPPPPEPTFSSGPYKFHIRVYNRNRQNK